MPFEINKPLEWLAKALGRSKRPGAGDRLPRVVQEQIVAGVDVLGWERFLERQVEVTTVAGALTEVEHDVIPEGICRLVLNANFVHTVIAENLRMWIAIRTRRSGSEVDCMAPRGNAADTVVPVDTPVGIVRPVLLLPGDRLVGLVQTATNAGSTSILTSMFIDLPPGEYIPGLG